MKKKKIKKTHIGLRISIIILFLVSIVLFSSNLDYMMNKEAKILSPQEANEISNSCKNKTIFEGANCVNQIVKQIYKYNMSNVGEELTFYRLLKEGGVCEHIANLYCQIGDELGYNTELVSFKTGKIKLTNKTKETQIAHVFCIWANDLGWVGLDQKEIFEFRFGKQNNTELIEILLKNEKTN